MKCYYMDVRPLADPALFAHVLQSIPWPERRERVLRCRRPEDQRLSLGANALLLHFLSEIAYLDVPTLHFREGQYGKPSLQEHPELFFNLSHSGHYAAIAAGDTPCGVDVEKTRTRYDRIAARYFTEEENALLSRCRDCEERDWTFLRIWTRKESFLKRTGEGLSRDLRSFCVLPVPPADTAFFEHPLPGHLLTVCTRGHVPFSGFEDIQIAD